MYHELAFLVSQGCDLRSRMMEVKTRSLISDCILQRWVAALLCLSVAFLLYAVFFSGYPHNLIHNPVLSSRSWVNSNVSLSCGFLQFFVSCDQGTGVITATQQPNPEEIAFLMGKTNATVQETGGIRRTGNPQLSGKGHGILPTSEVQFGHDSADLQKLGRYENQSHQRSETRHADGDFTNQSLAHSELQIGSDKTFEAQTDSRIAGLNLNNATIYSSKNSTVEDTGHESLADNGQMKSEAGFSNGIEMATVFQENLKNGTANSSGDANLKEAISNETSAGQTGLSNQCDLFTGKWVYDDSYPLYQPASCPFVDEGFSCIENGRPDLHYMRWRWKPDGCEVPRFNATDMLERLRGKRLVFVGDSLNRNQFESLLCILREPLYDKRRMVEIHGRRITKGQGVYSFKFLDYNCYVEFYRSHFLVDEGKTNNNRTRKSRLTLKLDKIDRSQSNWRNAYILIFNTGHWWSHSKTAKGRNFFQEGEHVHSKLLASVAYKKALNTWAAWVDKHIDSAKSHVYFRGYSPAHFWGGQWNSGGQCHKETLPIFNASFVSGYSDKLAVVEKVIQQMNTRVILLNVTKLSEYRKDAHPSIYGHKESGGKVYQDCSHWCLPGLPDIWNELLYASLVMPNYAV